MQEIFYKIWDKEKGLYFENYKVWSKRGKLFTQTQMVKILRSIFKEHLQDNKFPSNWEVRVFTLVHLKEFSVEQFIAYKSPTPFIRDI